MYVITTITDRILTVVNGQMLKKLSSHLVTLLPDLQIYFGSKDVKNFLKKVKPLRKCCYLKVKIRSNFHWRRRTGFESHRRQFFWLKGSNQTKGRKVNAQNGKYDAYEQSYMQYVALIGMYLKAHSDGRSQLRSDGCDFR